MLKIGEVAKRLADATDQDADQISRALRGWVQRSWLRPTDRKPQGGLGKIEVALFDREALVRARIHLAAASVGLNARLGVLDHDLRLDVCPVTGRQIESNPGLDRAIKSALAKDGDEWAIQIAILRRSATDPVATRWLKNGKPDSVAQGIWKKFEAEIEAIVTLPVTRHLARLDLS